MDFSTELKCEQDFEALGRAVNRAVRSEWYLLLLHKSIIPVLVGRTPALPRGGPSLLPVPSLPRWAASGLHRPLGRAELPRQRQGGVETKLPSTLGLVSVALG